MNTKEHFNGIAATYNELRPTYAPLMDKLAEVLEIAEGDKVVDYGCSTGHDLRYLADKYKVIPIGVDNSKEMVRIATRIIGSENVFESDNQFIIENINYDKIFFKFVMHHIQSPCQFIDDIICRLKTGSFFAIVTMLPANVSSYIVLRYFPRLRPLLENEAARQFDLIEHIKKNRSINFNVIEHDISIEIVDETLIQKIQRNYSSFFSSLSVDEKNDGIEKIKYEMNGSLKKKHFTRGVICYGRKK